MESETTTTPQIVESYSDYSPPFDVRKTVSRMLIATPPDRLVGLRAVVLTNKASLSHKRRRGVTWARKRKVRIANASGLYHPRWGSDAAWIEVFVDEILRPWRWSLNVPLWRDMLVSEVLFHEVGHHIQSTSHPEFREHETVADEWRDRLRSRYFRQEYPWLVLVAYPVNAIRSAVRLISRFVRRFRRG